MEDGKDNLIDNVPMHDKQRRSERVTFSEPCVAQVGRKPALLIDVSLGGLRVAQQEPGSIGHPRTISFQWDGRRVSFVCELRWLRAEPKNVFYAGYEVVQGTAESYDIVRAILGRHGAQMF
jgi:hypothetical protein